MGNPWKRTSSAFDQTEKQGLRILYTNARSIVNKVQELKLYVLNVDPDVIIITETWTHSAISNDFLNIPNYYITARHDRSDTLNGRGGGILIYGMPFLLPSNNLQQSTNLKTPMTNTNPQKNIPDFNSMKRHRGPLCIANSH